MRTSVHVSRVQIPHSDHDLLFHTLRGSVDIVPREVGLAVGQCDDSGADSSSSLSQDEVDILKGRGYLTEREPAQELDQVRTVLNIAAKNLKRHLELTLRFPAQDESLSQDARDHRFLDEVFALAAKAAGENGQIVVNLEISSTQVDAALMDALLETALASDYPILPQAAPQSLDALSLWVKSENFSQLSVLIDGSTGPVELEGLPEKIIGFFEHQVPVALLCKVDDMTTEQLKAVQSVRERVRQKYSRFLVSLLSDKCLGTDEAGELTLDETRLPFISAENETVLGMLMRFTLMPQVINYKPFFQPGPEQLRADLSTGQLTYSNAPDDSVEGKLDQIRAALEDRLAPQNSTPAWEMDGQSSACLSCKYALVCGRDWIGTGGFADAEQCANSFERRMAQTLPLLLFNLRNERRSSQNASA
jgi:hypothetical protein